MAEKWVKTFFGDTIKVDDSRTTSVTIMVDNGERAVAARMTPDDARKLARTLDAFAEIYSN